MKTTVTKSDLVLHGPSNDELVVHSASELDCGIGARDDACTTNTACKSPHADTKRGRSAPSPGADRPQDVEVNTAGEKAQVSFTVATATVKSAAQRKARIICDSGMSRNESNNELLPIS